MMAPERFERLALVAPSPRYIDDVNYIGGFTKNNINGLLSAPEEVIAALRAFLPVRDRV